MAVLRDGHVMAQAPQQQCQRVGGVAIFIDDENPALHSLSLGAGKELGVLLGAGGKASRVRRLPTAARLGAQQAATVFAHGTRYS